MLGLLLCLQLSGGVADSAAFADALMRQGDYFRAISEYKRVLFYNRNDSIQNYCLAQIAKSYRKSFKYESAIRYSAGLLNRANISPALRRQSNLNLGLSYLENKMPQLSLPYLQTAAAGYSTGFPLLCLGLAELEMKNLDKASTWFRDAGKIYGDSAFHVQILDISEALEKFKHQPRKSPFLASALSFFLPGSGQLYSGHAYDAFQAFLYTASFAFATYSVYKYEHAFKEHLGLTYVGISITAIFHAANLIGANRTAKYRNWKSHRDFAENVYDAVMLHEP